MKRKPTLLVLKKNYRGLTMVEMLIAMLILSLGLLGLAAMQETGMRNSQSAYLRTQATISPTVGVPDRWLRLWPNGRRQRMAGGAWQNGWD